MGVVWIELTPFTRHNHTTTPNILGEDMTKKEILDRIWNVLNQGVDTESGDLDLLRHDLENDVIAEDKFHSECG